MRILPNACNWAGSIVSSSRFKGPSTQQPGLTPLGFLQGNGGRPPHYCVPCACWCAATAPTMAPPLPRSCRLSSSSSASRPTLPALSLPRSSSSTPSNSCSKFLTKYSADQYRAMTHCGRARRIGKIGFFGGGRGLRAQTDNQVGTPSSGYMTNLLKFSLLSNVIETRVIRFQLPRTGLLPHSGSPGAQPPLHLRRRRLLRPPPPPTLPPARPAVARC